MRARASRGESGQALVVALTVVLLLAAAFALVAGFLVSRMHQAAETTRRTVLLALSDAAVAETVANLAASPVYPGLGERAFGGGTISSRVSRPGADLALVRARATYEGRKLVVEVRVRTVEGEPPTTVGWRRVPPSEREAGGGSFKPPR